MQVHSERTSLDIDRDRAVYSEEKVTMKTLTILVLILPIQGCTALMGAMGIGASDLLPSLKYCHHVDYQRRGIDLEVKAECRVPAG